MGKQDGERIWINLLLGSQANSEAALKIINGEKRMNKRGQFFIIFAVIIGLFVMGITTLYNSLSKTEFNAQNFYDACDNYNYEIHRISEEASKNLGFGEETAIKLFTLNFTKYHREKGNNISLVYLYSNGDSIKVLNLFYETINVKIDSNNNEIPGGCEITDISNCYVDNMDYNSNININISSTTKSLNNHDFYYLIQLKKGDEIFSCES